MTKEEICKCGHHTKDHSYYPDLGIELPCDICECKNFEPKEK